MRKLIPAKTISKYYANFSEIRSTPPHFQPLLAFVFISLSLVSARRVSALYIGFFCRVPFEQLCSLSPSRYVVLPRKKKTHTKSSPITDRLHIQDKANQQNEREIMKHANKNENKTWCFWFRYLVCLFSLSCVTITSTASEMKEKKIYHNKDEKQQIKRWKVSADEKRVQNGIKIKETEWNDLCALQMIITISKFIKWDGNHTSCFRISLKKWREPIY